MGQLVWGNGLMRLCAYEILTTTGMGGWVYEILTTTGMGGWVYEMLTTTGMGEWSMRY